MEQMYNRIFPTGNNHSLKSITKYNYIYQHLLFYDEIVQKSIDNAFENISLCLTMHTEKLAKHSILTGLLSLSNTCISLEA